MTVRRKLLVGSAAVLGAAVFCLPLIATVSTEPLKPLLFLPIALVAMEFGTRGALLTACVALGVVSVWALAGAGEIGTAEYVTRGIGYLLIGVIVGYMADGLRRSGDAAQELIEVAPDAIVQVGAGGRIVVANQHTAAIFGYEREDLIGRTIDELVSQPLRAETAAAGVSWEPLALSGVRRDGSEFPVEISFSPAHGPAGPLLTAIIRDISDRKRMERELEHSRAELERQNTDLQRSNADLERFAYAASHDLTEPLHVVAGFLQLLARHYKKQLDEEADRYIEAALSGVQRMQDLIDALLRYARVGREELRRKPTDLGHVVEEALDDLGSTVEASEATIEVGQLPTVPVEPSLARQLFHNLISNAIKFSDDHPVVSVTALRDNGDWCFAVADNGVGIDSADADRVFEVFQRLHGREVSGTGIGLAVCKRIVELHHGTIQVEPRPEGGSVFRFTLPASG